MRKILSTSCEVMHQKKAEKMGTSKPVLFLDDHEGLRETASRGWLSRRVARETVYLGDLERASSSFSMRSISCSWKWTGGAISTPSVLSMSSRPSTIAKGRARATREKRAHAESIASSRRASPGHWTLEREETAAARAFLSLLKMEDQVCARSTGMTTTTEAHPPLMTRSMPRRVQRVTFLFVPQT